MAIKLQKNKNNMFIDHLKLCILTENTSLLIFKQIAKRSKVEKIKFGF